jgi:hypothetical protein
MQAQEVVPRQCQHKAYCVVVMIRSSPMTRARRSSMGTPWETADSQNYEYQKTYQVTDANGDPLVYTLNFRANVMAYNPWESQQPPYEPVYSPITILRSIDLPSPHGAYIFEYNHPQGFLTQVTFPTGGYIKYSYSLANTLPESDYVIERRVNDGVNERVWTYTRGANSICASSSREVTVTSEIPNERVVHCFDSKGLETTALWQEFAAGIWFTRKTVVTDWTTGPTIV